MDTLVLTVKRILSAAKDTATILLERADGQPLNYRAGQFLTFLLPAGQVHSGFQVHSGIPGASAGRELRRSYSFSSTPGVDQMAAITVKRVINGEVSRYLLDHLREGDELMSLLPAGRFVLEEEVAGSRNERRELFFITAGSGMAPVFSLLKEALLKEKDVRVVLISQFHDEESILFKSQLGELAEKYRGRFRWVNLLSTREGRLNNWWLEELLGGLQLEEQQGVIGRSDVHYADEKTIARELFYLCGPPAFMRMAVFTLRVMGFAGTQIKQEHFTVEYVPPPPLLTDTTPKKVAIRSVKKNATASLSDAEEDHSDSQTGRSDGLIAQFEVAWPVTILEAALNQGIPLPYSCRGGRCSTCVARCLSGKVKMSINEVLTEKDLEDGLVLTCVGYAETDISLEL
jgi:ring-1,2-phenylacetyl-CoA epoxidase subunit PaaE